MSYEIVCPDGLVRHLPFINAEDATADARTYTLRGCELLSDAATVRAMLGVTTRCHGGRHTPRTCQERGYS